VARLLEIFRREGCRPQPAQNHVLILIDQSCLDATLERSGVSSTALMTVTGDDYCVLRALDSTRLTCLNKHHRVQAAREFLSPRKKWWIADFYSSGKYIPFSHSSILTCEHPDLSPEVRQYLIEEYSNEKVPSDGEIYRKIRQYHFQRNLSFEARWWARLKGCRARNLTTLLKHPMGRSSRKLRSTSVKSTLTDVVGIGTRHEALTSPAVGL
jgi:Protein of unknown function (DUF3723)